jgi:hypothetical protein
MVTDLARETELSRRFRAVDGQWPNEWLIPCWDGADVAGSFGQSPEVGTSTSGRVLRLLLCPKPARVLLTD